MFVPGIQRRRVTEANTTARPGGRGASFRLLPLSAAILALLAGPARAEQAVQLGEINVKGSIIDDRFGDDAGSPTSTTSLSGRQIEEQHLENLIDALRAVPGVTADTQGGDDLKIKMRGVENQRYMGEKPGVAIIIDGVPVFERTGKVNIDLDNIQSLKVIKGGASYLFGEDALAGAVVITTKRGAGNKGVRAEYERGSFGYERRLLRAGFASDMLVGHLQYNLREAEGYHFQSNYSLESLSGNLRWLIDDSSDLSFGFETADRFRDKHGTVTGVTQAAEDPRGTVGKDYSRHYDISLERYNLTYSKDFSAQTNLLALLYEYSDHTVFWSGPSCYLLNAATGRYTANCRDINDAYTTLNDYQQTQRGLKTELRSGDEGFGWMGGLEFRRNQYLNLTTAMVDYAMRPQTGATPPPLTLTGAVGTDDDTREAANAAYTEFRWMPHADWTLTGNLRHDRINLNYDNVSPLVGETKRFSASSWRLGGAWQASPATSWFGNVSTGFRTPTVEQLYRGTLSPTGGVANNTDLTPERAVNYELGMRSRSTLLGWDASVEGALFLIDRTDFILDSNGQYAGSNGTFVGRYENIGGACSRGLEMSVKAPPRGGLPDGGDLP